MSAQPTVGSLALAVVLATAAGGGPSDPSSDVLFEDSFDDDRNGWGVVDDPDYGTAAFDGGDYVWALTGSIAHWLPAVLGDRYDRGELDMLDVTVRAEATVLAGDGVIGLFCRENPDTDAEWEWYEFVARDGFAAIRRADLEGHLHVLAESHDVSLPSREPFSIEATCNDDDGDAVLRLSLNGIEVLEATDDDPLANGVAGLQAYTFPAHEQLDVRWHHLTVTRAATAAGGASASDDTTAAFCDAAVQTEAAFVSEDPALIGPAVEAITAAAPAEVAETVAAVITNAETFGPEFETAYAELIGYLKGNCGFGQLNVVGDEYSFEGMPAELAAGPVIVTLDNTGTELHVVELLLIADDVTLTADELLALPEDEAMGMVTTVGAAFAAPGTQGYGIADLTAGRYLAICSIPQGLTPDVAAQFEGAEGTLPAGSEGGDPTRPELGPPHFVVGMVHEFTVV